MAHNQPNVQLSKYDQAELLLDTQTLRISVKNDKYNIPYYKIQLDKLNKQQEVSFITGLFAIGIGSLIYSSNEVSRTFKLNSNLNIAEEKTTKKKHLILSQIPVSNMIKIKKKFNNLNYSLNFYNQ